MKTSSAATLRLASLAIALIVWFELTSPVLAQTKKDTGDPSLLTLDRIFSSRDFVGEFPPALRWRSRGSSYVVQEGTANGQQLVAHDPAGGKSEVLVPDHWLIPADETRPIGIEDYSFSGDESKLLIYTNSKRVWRTNARGDYWVLDMSTRQLKKLGGNVPPSTMQFATFSPDGKKVAYVHKNNIYVQDLGDFKITQLTKDGSDTIINGTFDWVYEEELFLRNGFRWSPDSQKIAFWQLDCSGVKEFFITNSADGPYPRLISIRYPKTGEKNSAARIGLVDVDGQKMVSLAIPGDPREHYLAKMEWAKMEVAGQDFDHVVVQQFNRLQNTNRVMFVMSHGNGSIPAAELNIRTILTEKDDAWVENDNDFRWINEGKQLVWLSERDGWRHIYLISRETSREGKFKLVAPAKDKVKFLPPENQEVKSTTQLTKGKFDVIHIDAIDEKGGYLYYTASPDNPTQRYLYRIALKGGEPERLSPADQPGTHSYSISPDAKWAVHTYSRFGKAPVSSLVHLPDHKVEKVLAGNAALSKKLDALKLGQNEFFRVKIEEGVELDGWCIKPPNFDPAKKYAVLFYVYGEPAGQTVLDRWDGRKYLWHSMLAQQGYLVMSIDNRGTPAPRGRAWRKIIYRQVGILAAADQAAAVKTLLKERPYMDPARIAIWGWSGGGSMTLNAIFRYPELYQTGMSIAPVPNQRHYDTIYQERYMGLPSDNVEGYRKGSPVHFAKYLKGNLLIAHGTGDDNCHYLGVETLIDELITYNKQFTMLPYPNRSHSISEGRNTTRHLFETLTRYLKTHTPP